MVRRHDLLEEAARYLRSCHSVPLLLLRVQGSLFHEMRGTDPEVLSLRRGHDHGNCHVGYSWRMKAVGDVEKDVVQESEKGCWARCGER